MKIYRRFKTNRKFSAIGIVIPLLFAFYILFVTSQVYFHNLNYLEYAYLQLGRYRDAQHTVDIIAEQYRGLADQKTAPDTPELQSRHVRGRTIYAVDIAGDLRAVFYLEGETIWSVSIGTHDIYET